jgi:hypothetical protein
MNFCPHCPHLLSNLGEIWYYNLHILMFSICEFHENWRLEGPVFLTGSRKLHLRVFREIL